MMHHKKLSRTIKPNEIMRFMRQFATLINAGITPVIACDIITGGLTHLGMTSLVYQIKHDMLAGKSLYVSFARHSLHFKPVICQLIRVGEETGTLDQTLDQAARYLEQQENFKKSIRQMLVYPAITASTACLITLSMLVLVIPRFASLFEATNVHLPLWTRFLFALSAFLIDHSAMLVTGIASIVVFIVYSFPPETWQSQFLKLLKSLPVIRSHHQQCQLTAFTTQLAVTFNAGIPLPDALTLCKPERGQLERAVHQIRAGILAGQPFHACMQTQPSFPPFLTQMIKAGEASGKLHSMLQHIALELENDTRQQLQQLTKLLEPLIILTLGVVIGGVIIGMYLPVFQLGSAL